MIISKTPYRISFFGGGTDYPVWYKEHGGAVLSTTIDKYCYISCRRLPPFFKHKFRIVYSRIESVNEPGEIEHPSVREVLKWACLDCGLEIHHDGDLPARSGLGTSSSFTVGMINAIRAHQGFMTSKKQLACDALKIEQERIKEDVGSQDQVAVAYGGFNRIDFYQSGEFSVSPIIAPTDRLQALNDNLLLFFTGVTRFSASFAKNKIKNLSQREKELFAMRDMVEQAVHIVSDRTRSLDTFGDLLHEAWRCKKSLSSTVSTPEVDEWYEKARQAGALGGKLLGAGGGGFMLFYVPQEKQDSVKAALSCLVHVPFSFERAGSTIEMYEPNGL